MENESKETCPCANCGDTVDNAGPIILHSSDGEKVCADCFSDDMMEFIAEQREREEALSQAPEYVYCEKCDEIIDQKNYPDFKRNHNFTKCYPCEVRETGNEIWICTECADYTGFASTTKILPTTKCSYCRCE